jgi:hypothetical protein
LSSKTSFANTLDPLEVFPPWADICCMYNGGVSGDKEDEAELVYSELLSSYAGRFVN